MTDKIYTIEQIRGLLSPVFKRYSIRSAVLFGSYAKNAATPKSDIDLLVDSNLKGLKFVGLMEDIQNAIDKDVDVLDVTHIEKDSKINSEIMSTGVTIYEK